MRVGRGSFAATVLLLLLAALAWRSIVDVDFGLHMAGGRFVAEHRSVPAADPFTWTLGERAYVAYHWLFQLGLYEIWSAAGAPGVVAARFFLLVATASLLLVALRARRVSALAAAAVGLTALLASEWRFTARPELLSWLLFASVLALLERRRRGYAAPLWLLPPIFLLWVNVHVWVPGFALVTFYAADECWQRRSLRTPLVGFGAASLLVMLVNPYGVHGLLYPLTLATRFGAENVFAKHIDELVSPFAIAPDPSRPFTTGVQIQAYRLLVFAGVAAAVVHLRARRWLDAALLAVFGVLAALAVRNVVLYAIVATPAICAALDVGLSRARLRPRAEWAGLAAILGFAALLLPRVVSGVFYAEGRRQDRFAAELCTLCLASDTADWLARSGLEGHGLNNLVLGSTLLWRDPAHPVFIDGRNEVTGEAFYGEYLGAMDAGRWPETAERWSLEYVALAHRGDARARDLARALEADAAWRLVHVDGAGAVFVRIAGPNGNRPAAALPATVLRDERRAALDALARETTRRGLSHWLWSTERPPGAAHGLGSFLLAVGRPAAAEAPLLEAAAAHPGFWEPRLDLGLLYRAEKRPHAAMLAFQSARRLFPEHPGLSALEDPD